MRVFCEQHNQVVPRLVLAQLYQVLCPHFAGYEPSRLCLGDVQHPKIAANKMRAIKTKQKMQITTSPPRAQSLVEISLFRSCRSEDAACSSDILASTLLGATTTGSGLVFSPYPQQQPQNQCRYAWCLCLQASPSKRKVTLHRNWSRN